MRLRQRGGHVAAAGMLLVISVWATPASAGESGPGPESRKPVVTVPTWPEPVTDPPYRGWSSWSLQSSTYPGLNPRGPASWLNEANVLAQARAMARHLKPYGYEYVNIDSGWNATWDWEGGFDEYGRQRPDPERFPRGMAYVAGKIHRLGLKAGIYLPVGLEKPAYDNGDFPIAGAPECSTHDIVYADLRTTNGWDSSYKIDFNQPCAQAYIDSQAALIAGWGFDFLKLDGVGPGSSKTGPNYDNRRDVEAWHEAIARTERDIRLELSWALDRSAIDHWQEYADGWRIDTDVECYCDTLVTWANSVDDRFSDVPSWVPYAGPEGWNNLDALNVGNGEMDGLTDDERRSYMTLWAISAAPLYPGDDLTRLDELGLKLLTHRGVLAINAQGRPASPVVPNAPQQVWRVQNTDGTYTVALFNLDEEPAMVEALWTDLGFTGDALVRDVWAGTSLGSRSSGYAATVPAHGSRLLQVVPKARAATIEAEAPGNVLSGTAKVLECTSCSGGLKAGDLGTVGSSIKFTGIQISRADTYNVTVSYVDGSGDEPLELSINDAKPQRIVPGRDGEMLDRPQTQTLPIRLVNGENSLTFATTGSHALGIDKITIQR